MQAVPRLAASLESSKMNSKESVIFDTVTMQYTFADNNPGAEFHSDPRFEGALEDTYCIHQKRATDVGSSGYEFWHWVVQTHAANDKRPGGDRI